MATPASTKIPAIELPETNAFDSSVKTRSLSGPLAVKSTDAQSDLMLLPDALDAFADVSSEYNNKYDPKANKFTSDAKQRYITADKAYYAKTKTNMSICSGRRTVARQGELFVLYKWHGQGNPASWPGCSFHNWGLAADMVRTHEAALVAAMKASGWTKTVGDEGWHFECTGSADHNKAATKIASFRKKSGLAYKWSEQVAHFYIKTRTFNKRVPVYNQRLENHKTNLQILQADINTFNQAVDRLKKRIAQYNNDARHFNSELARAKRLVDEINSMPSGPARDRKIREFRQLEAWLNAESGRLNRESGAIDRDNERLSKESAALDARIVAFQKEDAWLTAEDKALTTLQKEIPEHKASANKLLSQISAAVP